MARRKALVDDFRQRVRDWRGLRRGAGASLLRSLEYPGKEERVPDEGTFRLPAAYGGIRDLQKEFRAYQQAAFPEREPRFFALELCGEAGELANLEKKLWKGRAVADAAFADEVADVFIALVNYANARGVDLARQVAGKMKGIDRRRIEQPDRPG